MTSGSGPSGDVPSDHFCLGEDRPVCRLLPDPSFYLREVTPIYRVSH